MKTRLSPRAKTFYAQTHPDRLATIGTLLGMNPAPVESCRVLEMGCGAGGNLIPMAFDLAGSSFIGIDLAGSAIAQGRELIAALGLKNISLQRLDVMAFPSELGQIRPRWRKAALVRVGPFRDRHNYKRNI